MIDRIAYVTCTKLTEDSPLIPTQFGTQHYIHQALGLLGYE